jgi:hypothetical protein
MRPLLFLPSLSISFSLLSPPMLPLPALSPTCLLLQQWMHAWQSSRRLGWGADTGLRPGASQRWRLGAMGGLASGECMRQQPPYRRNPMVEINNTLEGNDKSNLNFYATSCKWYCRIKLIDPTVIDGYRNSVTTPSPWRRSYRFMMTLPLRPRRMWHAL